MPPASETLTYDDDGNLLSDGHWFYTWDAENRLIRQEESLAILIQPPGSAPLQRRRLDFVYDAGGRRVRKEVSVAEDSSTTFILKQQTVFLYDGWNMIAEYHTLNGTQLVRSYEWGMDVSGSMEGAGGVGGLLVIREHSNTTGAVLSSHAPLYDGNVMELVSITTSTLSARYEYTAFGETISVDGAAIADANPFRFSTKYQDAESGWYYYGYRYYAPELGRWLNRDPIGEEGGENLSSMVTNDPVNLVDYLGLSTSKEAGHNSLMGLATQMKAKCQTCCKDVAACEADADKIASAIINTWDNNYGNGKNQGRHPVGGWMCRDWSAVFKQAADAVGSKSWTTNEERWWNDATMSGDGSQTAHFALRLSACCNDKKDECSVFIDDGWGPPVDELVHTPPWPGPPYDPVHPRTKQRTPGGPKVEPGDPKRSNPPPKPYPPTPGAPAPKK